MDPSIAPASRAAAVTPNDTAIVGARALYIGTAGDVAIAPRRDMDPVIFKSVLRLERSCLFMPPSWR